MCSGFLPPGAEEHPFNPANEVEVVEFIKCDVYDCYAEVENEGDVCPKCLAESEACAPDADVMGMAVPKSDHAE